MNTPAKPLSVALDGGLAIRGVFPDPAVCALIRETSGCDLPLTIADPPYGNILDDDWDNVGDDDKGRVSYEPGDSIQDLFEKREASMLHIVRPHPLVQQLWQDYAFKRMTEPLPSGRLPRKPRQAATEMTQPRDKPEGTKRKRTSTSKQRRKK